jgi:hypothetical protein
MGIMHVVLLGCGPLSDQLRSLPLKVNHMPSGCEFQRRESKSRHRPKVCSQMNQNLANRSLPLLTSDVTCCRYSDPPKIDRISTYGVSAPNATECHKESSFATMCSRIGPVSSCASNAASMNAPERATSVQMKSGATG